MQPTHLTLTPRQTCDLELIMNGGFAPLSGFLQEKDYQSVLDNMRLSSGQVWPMPIVLDVTAATASALEKNPQCYLCNEEGLPLAKLNVTTIWQPDKTYEAQAVFGTTDEAHPGVHYLFHQTNDYYIGGDIETLNMPMHFDFSELRLTPTQLKNKFAELGWKKIVAFQTRNPMHRAHQELTLRAAYEQEANILLHPVVGLTKPGDINHFARVRCYQKIIQHYPANRVLLSLLPLAMRMAGPREALWHALIRKNYGCTHFIVGRDHAGPGNDSHGQAFYDPYAAQQLVAEYADEIGMQMVPFKEMVYVKNKKCYQPVDELAADDQVEKISGTEFRRRLNEQLPLPAWFSYPEIIEELRKIYPSPTQQGLTLFFTGLSGAGKSTLAKALIQRLQTFEQRNITLLDGDLVRKLLSSELTFSKEHRDLNIKRIGYVASEITKHGGIAVCAPIAPYRNIRRWVREQVKQYGNFVEIYVATPLNTCEDRDPKGLYARARQGIIPNFTGIDDPYETPENAEVTIDTTDMPINEALNTIIAALENLGVIARQSVTIPEAEAEPSFAQ